MNAEAQTPTLTAADLIACAKRELAFRKRVYPRQVQAGKMSPEDADHEIACMTVLLKLAQEQVAPSLP